MVEEMMLLANTSVAAAILKAYPACALLRRHPTPQPRNFEPLLAAATAAGFSLDVSTSKVPAAAAAPRRLAPAGAEACTRLPRGASAGPEAVNDGSKILTGHRRCCRRWRGRWTKRSAHPTCTSTSWCLHLCRNLSHPGAKL